MIQSVFNSKAVHMHSLLRTYQAARVVVGIVLILAALQFRRFDEFAQTLAKDACTRESGIYCTLMNFAFVTLGLGGFWALMIIWGAYYAFIYDWIMPSLERLATSIAGNVVEAVPIVLRRIRDHALKADDLKALMLAVFENSSGSSDADGRGLGQFVSDQLLYKRQGFLWRRRHNTQVRIEELEALHLQSNYLRWIEDTSYELVSPAKNTPFRPVRLRQHPVFAYRSQDYRRTSLL